MGFLDFFKGLFGAGPSGGDDGLYYYVKCGRCSSIVQLRVSRSSEMRQLFQESDGMDGYAVRKVVVDAKCFRPMEVNVTYDRSRRETERQIEGGAFVDRAAYDASKAAPGT